MLHAHGSSKSRIPIQHHAATIEQHAQYDRRFLRKWPVYRPSVRVRLLCPGRLSRLEKSGAERGVRYDYYSSLVAHPSSNGGQGTGFYNPNGLLDGNFNVGPFRSPNNPYNPDAGLNLGPRFGFSYSPGTNSKTVIRGGFGVIFSAQVAGAMW